MPIRRPFGPLLAAFVFLGGFLGACDSKHVHVEDPDEGISLTYDCAAIESQAETLLEADVVVERGAEAIGALRDEEKIEVAQELASKI